MKVLWLAFGYPLVCSIPRKQQEDSRTVIRFYGVNLFVFSVSNYLFDGAMDSGQCPDGIVELAQIACRGGWPAEIKGALEDAQAVVREYLRLIFEEGVPRFGGDPLLARRTALSVARNLGQAPTN